MCEEETIHFWEKKVEELRLLNKSNGGTIYGLRLKKAEETLQRKREAKGKLEEESKKEYFLAKITYMKGDKIAYTLVRAKDLKEAEVLVSNECEQNDLYLYDIEIQKTLQ